MPDLELSPVPLDSCVGLPPCLYCTFVLWTDSIACVVGLVHSVVVTRTVIHAMMILDISSTKNLVFYRFHRSHHLMHKNCEIDPFDVDYLVGLLAILGSDLVGLAILVAMDPDVEDLES